jgi:hypothetical protein
VVAGLANVIDAPTLFSLGVKRVSLGGVWPTRCLRETADLTCELLEQAADSGDLDRQDEHLPDEAFIRLMDSFADASHPAVARLRELIAEQAGPDGLGSRNASPEASRRDSTRV